MGPVTSATTRRAGLVARHRVRIRRRVPIPADDGALLRATICEPRGLRSGPTVLVRSPYGRIGFELMVGRPLAAQGYRVVIQSCRGTVDADGRFQPYRHEEADGLAAIDWILDQQWCDGSIFTWGMSYLGSVQWAVAASAPPQVKAMALQITTTDWSQLAFAGGSFQLEGMALWARLMGRLRNRRDYAALVVDFARGAKDPGRPEAWRRLPLRELDRAMTGHVDPLWRDMMAGLDPRDPVWRWLASTDAIQASSRPMSFVTGWDDIVLPWTCDDVAALQRRGVPVRLTIGPWSHSDERLFHAAVRDGLDWFERHRHPSGEGPDPLLDRPPVRYYLQGADRWEEARCWPPPDLTAAHYGLGPGARLVPVPETGTESGDRTGADSATGAGDRAGDRARWDRFVYDPLDPTPSLGGPHLSRLGARVDNRPLEDRPDTLVYTSEPLAADLDVIGTPVVVLGTHGDTDQADWYARLCDVDLDGVSWSVCDGLQRATYHRANVANVTSNAPADCTANADGPVPVGLPMRVTVNLWPTAYRFRAGHRIRLVVAGGAFPRWARNLGTAEPWSDATTIEATTQTVEVGGRHVSRIRLPVRVGPTRET